MPETCPNDLPIGKFRLWLHERHKQASDTARAFGTWTTQGKAALIEARAYGSAMEQSVRVEGEQQELDKARLEYIISLRECLDRCGSALADSPGFQELIDEIDGLLDRQDTDS